MISADQRQQSSIEKTETERFAFSKTTKFCIDEEAGPAQVGARSSFLNLQGTLF